MAVTSPLPWSFERVVRAPGWHLFIRDASGQVVTHKPTFRPHSARDEANYRLIVAAVNATTQSDKEVE